MNDHEKSLATLRKKCIGGISDVHAFVPGMQELNQVFPPSSCLVMRG